MTLLELLSLVRKHLQLVIVMPIVFALITALFSFVFLADTYTAETSMYVLAKAQSQSDGITNTELTASQMLTNDVAVLIKSSRVQNEAAQAVGMETLDDFKVNVDSSTTTRIITVSVTGKSSSDVAIVANQLADTADAIAQQVMDVQSINVIDKAAEPKSPSGPPRLMYTAVALLAGLFVAIALVVLMDMANTRVRSAEDASEMLGIPIVGRIPVIKA